MRSVRIQKNSSSRDLLRFVQMKSASAALGMGIRSSSLNAAASDAHLYLCALIYGFTCTICIERELYAPLSYYLDHPMPFAGLQLGLAPRQTWT
jgi:hypothetical protein